LGVLSRGYGIVRRMVGGTVIKSVRDAHAGETVEILVSDGRLVSDITRVEKGWS
jgi:exonuclease VII large subunit